MGNVVSLLCPSAIHLISLNVFEIFSPNPRLRWPSACLIKFSPCPKVAQNLLLSPKPNTLN